MSLITRCPACETLFKVVPDQLRISEGWVRCGQCDEIFDASLHLLPTSVEAEEEEGPVAQHEGPPTISEATDAPDAAVQLVDTESASTESIPDERVLLAASTATLPDDAAHADAYDTDADGAEPEHSAELEEVSFLRDHRPNSFWYKPLMRATLVLVSLALLLGLAGQIVLHERDRIVALQPGLKPWLLAICGPLNCTLSALRRIESIVIDSSSFSKIRGDAYRLNFTLKNTASTALAVPAMELTLTDSRDQPVVRRVFLPSELGVKFESLAADAEWTTSLAMAVNASAPVDRVVGYRLLAFYP